jgi:hypothetical protein
VEATHDDAADDDKLTDAKIFDPQQDNLDEAVLEFMVRDPQNSNGTMLYKITGRDKDGMFEGQRRYNDFFLLHETLRKRWPGIPIPCIPPKKSFNNKEAVFIQQRRYYLERFFRCIAKYDFLINSQEFRAFSRPSGMPIEKGLENLPKLTVEKTYSNIKESIGIDETEYDYNDRDKFSSRIVEFNYFVKKAKPFLA